MSHMAEGSSIINCASIQGYSPTPGVLDYATTKVHGCCCMLTWQRASPAALHMSLQPRHECSWRRCV